MRRRKKIFGVALFSAIIGCSLLCAVNLKSRVHRSDRIILIVADALRADHVGCYGAPGNPTPHIDALAARGWRFTDALAPGSETVTSNRALFTGLHPYRASGVGRQGALRPGVPTIASQLRRTGFHTVGFSAQPIVSGRFGFAQGFQSFTCLPSDDDRVTDSAIKWIARHRRQRYFALVYLLSPHCPYDLASISDRERHAMESTPSASAICTFSHQGDKTLVAPINDPRNLAFRQYFWPGTKLGYAKVALLHALYRVAVRSTDARVGRIMRAIGDDNRATVIFVADHGEEWREHGHLGHAHGLFREVLHVPFIICPPGTHPRTVSAPVTHMDIAPTIFNLARISSPPNLDGCSLAQPDAIPARTLFAENYEVLSAFRPQGFGSHSIHDLAAYAPGEAIFCCPEYAHAEDVQPIGFKWVRYDLAADPMQQHPLPLAASDSRCKTLRQYHIESRSATLEARVGSPAKLPSDIRDQLRALGYIAK